MKTVLHYLEQSALRFPDKTAVTDGETACTYGELQRRCRRIGTALAARAAAGQPVAVLLEKGVDALSAFWGIAYAGGCYALLNPDLPAARLRQIEQVLQPACLVTDAAHAAQARALFPSADLLLLETLRQTPVDLPLLQRVRGRMLDTDPLYINFTSGSTGRPKGVAVSHRSTVDFIDAFTAAFGFSAADVFGNQAPFDFDVSVKDIYTAAKVGGTLAILPKALFSQPMALLDCICERQVTVLIWAVSALCLVSAFHGLDYRLPTAVRKVLFSGEVMPPKHLRAWMDSLPQAQFVNLYGPTEITCNCTFHILDRARDYTAGVPIGRPFPNEQVFLLDAADRAVTEAGVPGELCVRGTALALGYYRDPAQTAAAFVQNPLNDRWPERIYRTGDLAQYTADGELLFCGRKDFQIKYQGHRIELEEIDRAVGGLSGVDRCCCVFEPQKERLYGFYTGAADPADLRRQLAELLPVYMLPRTLQRIEAFPLTQNGKIDRSRLLSQKGVTT